MKLVCAAKLLYVFASISAVNCRFKRRSPSERSAGRSNQPVHVADDEPPQLSARAIHTLEDSLDFSESNEDEIDIEVNVARNEGASLASIDLNCLNITQKKRGRSKSNDQKSVVDADKWAKMPLKADTRNFFSHFGFAVDRANDPNYQCAICLEAFKPNDFIFAMHPEKLFFDIAHVFHVACVEKLSQKACPLCKKNIIYRRDLVDCAKHHDIPSTIDGFSYLAKVSEDKMAKYAEYLSKLIDRELDDLLVKKNYLNFMFYAAINQKLSVEIIKAAPKRLINEDYENLIEIYTKNFDRSPLSLLLRLYETKYVNKKMARQIAKTIIKSAAKFDAFYYEIITFLNFCHVIFSPSKNYSYLRLITKHFYNFDYGHFFLREINESAAYLETLLLGCYKGMPQVVFDTLFPFLKYATELTLYNIGIRAVDRSQYDRKRMLPIIMHILKNSINDDLKLTLIVKLYQYMSGESIMDIIKGMDLKYQLRFHNLSCNVEKFSMVQEDIRKRVILIADREFYREALEDCMKYKDAKLLDALLQIKVFLDPSFLNELFIECVENYKPDMKSEIIFTILKDKVGPQVVESVLKIKFMSRSLSQYLLGEALHFYRIDNAQDSTDLLTYLNRIFENYASNKTPYPIPVTTISALVRKMTKKDQEALLQLSVLKLQSEEVIKLINSLKN